MATAAAAAAAVNGSAKAKDKRVSERVRELIIRCDQENRNREYYFITIIIINMDCLVAFLLVLLIHCSFLPHGIKSLPETIQIGKWCHHSV